MNATDRIELALNELDDRLGMVGLGGDIEARAALADLEALVADLVALVRIGFLTTVNGERATSSIVQDERLRALLADILTAEDTAAALARVKGDTP